MWSAGSKGVALLRRCSPATAGAAAPLGPVARFRQGVAGGDRYRWCVLWTVLFGLFSVNLTVTILAVALPRIAREMGTTANTLTWVITGPLLVFGVAAPA